MWNATTCLDVAFPGIGMNQSYPFPAAVRSQKLPYSLHPDRIRLDSDHVSRAPREPHGRHARAVLQDSSLRSALQETPQTLGRVERNPGRDRPSTARDTQAGLKNRQRCVPKKSSARNRFTQFIGQTPTPRNVRHGFQRLHRSGRPPNPGSYPTNGADPKAIFAGGGVGSVSDGRQPSDASPSPGFTRSHRET